MTEPPTQRGTTWLRAATPDQVEQAMIAGELADLLAGRDVPGDAPPERPQQLTRDHLATMTPQEIVKATSAGHFEDVLRGES